MKVVAVNGSPRKGWNTHRLLESALEGAKSNGAEAGIYNLYDLNFRGCISCFACKMPRGNSHGKCALKDDLSPVLEDIASADALILGSPIYFGSITGEMRSFIERLLFQYLVYDREYTSLAPKKLDGAFIYTMNVSETAMSEYGYRAPMEMTEYALKRTLGMNNFHSLHSTDTCQFDDYDKYGVTAFDSQHKMKRREEEFPKDIESARTIGEMLSRSE